jgi:ABC-type Fe3+/spermidine/putrescine transport system ATPase subunit
MNRGRIIQVGTPIDLYRSPASLFVAAFVGSSNVWQGEVVDSNEHGTVVSVDGTSMRGAIAPGMKPGDRVAMVLRAEVAHVSIAPRGEPVDPMTSLKGTVADVLFVGAVVNYQVDVAGRRVTVSRPSYEEALVLDEGKAVTVTWNSKDAHVLPAEAIDESVNSHTERRRNRP